jgi:S-adenosylmethionine decarboxylase
MVAPPRSIEEDPRVRDLAPQIVRQRLLVEAIFTVDVDADFVDRFLHGLAEHLDLRSYAEATIVAPGGQGREENEGFDAFLPLIDSGISLYVWTASRFLACVLFTCKQFDADRAVAFVNETFGTTDSTSLEF